MDKIKVLKSNHHKATNDLLLEMLEESKTTDTNYQYLDIFFDMCKDKNSHTKVIGFLLLCANAKWDKKNLISRRFLEITPLFHDENQAVVHQCIEGLYLLTNYKCNLKDEILFTLYNIDYSKYNESVRKLIENDVQDYINSLKEGEQCG